MNDSQQHQTINDSLTKQQRLVKNLRQVQYLRGEISILKEKNLQTRHILEEEPLQEDRGPGVGGVHS